MNLESNPIIKEDLENIISTSLPWASLQGKTIMITGGSGLLASYMVKTLLLLNSVYSLNIKVISVVRNLGDGGRLKDWMINPALFVYCQDISKDFSFDFPIADIVIHAASQASPKYYGIDPVGTLSANSIGTMQLLEYATRVNLSKFLFISSGEVYGSQASSDVLIGEENFGSLDPIKVRSCYAESKRIGETMCAAWAEQYGLHTIVARPFHTYGPGMLLNDGRVFADFVADVVVGRDIILKSDGLARRPFCYISDATIGFFTILLKGSPVEAYNLANPNAEVSMKDLAIKIASLFPDRKINIRYEIPLDNKKYLNSPIMRQCPSIEKIAKLGWHPRINIENGFRRTIMSYL
jgi:nucleoside-diphosphate-sugar epimerase